MKRLFASLSLPIGIFFLLLLALFSKGKEGGNKRSVERKNQPKKEVEKDARSIGRAHKGQPLLKNPKPYNTAVFIQQLWRWDSLVHQGQQAKNTPKEEASAKAKGPLNF